MMRSLRRRNRTTNEQPTTPTVDGYSADPRDRWRVLLPMSGAFTCCIHCAMTCRWNNHHPGPCARCIHEMETHPPLPDCWTEPDTGRCAICTHIHGVRITHNNRRTQ